MDELTEAVGGGDNGVILQKVNKARRSGDNLDLDSSRVTFVNKHETSELQVPSPAVSVSSNCYVQMGRKERRMDGEKKEKSENRK